MAKDTILVLSEDDVRVFREMRKAFERQRTDELNLREEEGDDALASGKFAWIPAAGIPARVVSIPETGTGTGTWDDADVEYTVYGTECQMYQEVLGDDGEKTVEKIEGITETVFNPTDVDIAGSQLVFTKLSRYGTRVPDGASGTATTIIRFKILSIGPFMAETSAYCLTVLGEVVDVSCGGAGVSIGDEVVIWDPSNCQFNIPAEVLVGMYGTAVKMKWSDDSTSTGTGTGTLSPIPGRDGGISTCVDDLGSGTGWVEGECWWMVQTLCCGEDIYY